MQAENMRVKMNCPMNGKTCKNGVRADFEVDETGQKMSCRFWTHVYGKDPQTEKVLDHFDCAMAWMPVVMLEVSQMSRQNTATMQSFRNETTEGLGKFAAAVRSAGEAFGLIAERQDALAGGFHALAEKVDGMGSRIVELPHNGWNGRKSEDGE